MINVSQTIWIESLKARRSKMPLLTALAFMLADEPDPPAFEYLDTARIHPKAIVAGINAIRSGRRIFTDTRMALSGIRKRDLERFGCQVSCLIDDPEVAARAKRESTTRARAAVDLAAGSLRRVR